MKRLTLVRHAQAEAALAGQRDFDRQLSRRGLQEAVEMARRLQLNRLTPDCIVTSAAPRAHSTALQFAALLGLHATQIALDERLYAADCDAVLEIVRDAPECRHLLVLGHNPTLTQFADRLSSERGIDALPTCGIVTMRIAIEAWRAVDWRAGVDVELDHPGRTG